MKGLSLWLCVAFVLQLTVLSANTLMSSSMGEKLYVAPGDIEVSEQGIFWQVQPGQWVPISRLQCDCHGTYLSIFDILGMWQCPVRGCENWNSNFVNTCQYCGQPKDGAE